MLKARNKKPHHHQNTYIMKTPERESPKYFQQWRGHILDNAAINANHNIRNKTHKAKQEKKN